MSPIQTKLWPRVPIAALSLAVLLGGPSQVMAQATLGCSQSFAVLGATTVTNTGATTIKGNLGVYPGSAITGSGSITLIGALHQNNAVAMQAQGCALSAFNSLFLLPFPPGNDLSTQDLGGMTLQPGVYSFSSLAQLTGTLFLDFLTSPNSPFVFQIGSSFTTASGSSVSAVGGGPFGEVYWLIGSSATLGTGTAFQGNIIAKTSIALQTGTTIVCGRAIALTGAVTMDNNVVSNDCVSPGGTSGNENSTPIGFPGGNATVVPEPSTLALLVVPFGVGLVALVRRGRRSPPGSVRS